MYFDSFFSSCDDSITVDESEFAPDHIFNMTLQYMTSKVDEFSSSGSCNVYLMYDDVYKGTVTKSPKYKYTKTGDNTATIVYQYSSHIDILNLIKCYDETVDLDLFFRIRTERIF